MEANKIQTVSFFNLDNPAPRIHVGWRITGQRPDRTFQRPMRRKLPHAKTHRALVAAKFHGDFT
jgi:hypothetical protein